MAQRKWDTSPSSGRATGTQFMPRRGRRRTPYLSVHDDVAPQSDHQTIPDSSINHVAGHPQLHELGD